MALNLSSDQRRQLEIDMSAAVPYDDDSPEVMTFDTNEYDSARLKATMAKRLLEQDDREKANRA